MDWNRSGSISVGLPSRLRRTQPVDQAGQRDRADAQERADGLAALLPDQDAEHDAAHADDGQDRADDVDLRGTRCTGTSRTSLMPDSTTAMITTSSANPTRHDR